MINQAEGLLGRERELAAAAHFLATLENGPATLVLEGESGIGKTVLFEHTIAEAERTGKRILAARPTRAESALSFAGLTDLLLDARETFEELPSPQRRALAIALLLDDAPDAAPDLRAIGTGLLGVLRALASRPIVVAVDDLQWLDPASAAALSFALRRVTDEPIGLLAALRTDTDVPAADLARYERITLGPLSVGAIHALLTERLQLSIPRSLLLRVHDACRGNPLFAQEIGRALEERGLPEPGRPFEIPADAETLFAARLEHLPSDTLDALAVAAVIAAPTRFLVDASALEPAIRSKIIRLAGERIHFTHPLLASAAYTRLDATARRELHRRIATATTDREERARHLALAANAPDGGVAASLDEAAEQAARRGAPAAAAELAELAVKLTPGNDAERFLVRRRVAAQHYYHAGDVARARAILEELVEELQPGTERARALLQLSAVRAAGVPARRSLLEQALLEGVADDHTLVAIHHNLAETFQQSGNRKRALAESRKALRVAERTGDTHLLASGLTYVAFFELWAGRVTPGLLERALRLEPQAGYLRLYESPVVVDGLRSMLVEDDLDRARARLSQAEQVARDHGDDDSRIALLLHLAELECRSGRFDDAARYAIDGYALADQLGLDEAKCSLLYAVALADALRGRAEPAREAADRGLALAEKAGNEIYTIQNLRVLGLLALSTGDWSAAARILAPLPERLAAQGYGQASTFRIVPDAIEALIQAGEQEMAAALADELERTARTLGIAWALARSARCRGLLAASERNYDGAFRAFQEALDAHQRLPDPLERGRTLLALGQTMRRASRRREARETLQQALAIFDRIGAALWAEQARAELGRLGGRTPSADALTGAEERVAQLVAEGKTNREVAATLFVTERTVETHLSSIYRKLELRSRSELAGHLAGSRTS